MAVPFRIHCMVVLEALLPFGTAAPSMMTSGLSLVTTRSPIMFFLWTVHSNVTGTSGCVVAFARSVANCVPGHCTGSVPKESPGMPLWFWLTYAFDGE